MREGGVQFDAIDSYFGRCRGATRHKLLLLAKPHYHARQLQAVREWRDAQNAHA